MSADVIRKIASPIETPRPLMRALPGASNFPVNALGDVLAPAARAINDRVQAPLAVCAQSVLAAATLAVQAHADIRLPHGQVKPISSYFVTVAQTGERKSAADAEAIGPISAHEAVLRANFDQARLSYQNESEAWVSARGYATRKHKGDRAAIKTALDALGPAPAPPLQPILTCPEPTFEGLCKLLLMGQPSVGVLSAEGGQFVGGHGMNPDNKLKTAAGLSDVWDGAPIRRVRSGDGAFILPGRRVCMHLMLQPAVADMLLGDSLLAEQGLLSRMLVAAPDTAAGTRFQRAEQPETDGDLKRYGARLLAILQAELPLVSGKQNELSPRVIELHPQAGAVLQDYADQVERAIAPDGELDSVRGLANKLPEHAARIAAVLSLVGNMDALEIDGEHMKAGILLAAHYGSEALRLFGGAQISNDVRLAQRLLHWLRTRWTMPIVSLPDIYQGSLNAIGDKATASKIVCILEDHGWLLRIPEGATVKGKVRRDAWRVIEGA